jgi:electron transport complex protein RnfE
MSSPQPGAGAILEQGLWSNNTGLVQLLGLCPLLAVSNGAVNALGLGLATVLVLTATNLAISVLRRHASPEIRIPAYVVVIATTVTCVELAMNAWLHELYQVLGLFIPLIVTNCAVMGRAEAFAARHAPWRAALDGFAIGTGFLVVLFAIGCVREVVGQGTLFAGAGRYFGPLGEMLEVRVIDDYRGFLPAVLPFGAFIVLALLIAGKNALDARRRARAAAAPRDEAAA